MKKQYFGKILCVTGSFRYTVFKIERMPLNLSIFLKTAAAGYTNIHNTTEIGYNGGQTYGVKKDAVSPRKNMDWTLSLICFVWLIASPVLAEGDYFPGNFLVEICWQ
jgi:hypothetical protein